MKLPSYKDSLKMGKEKVQEMLIPIKITKARKRAELELCKLDEEIATKEASLSEECTADEVNFVRIIEMLDDIGLLERKRAQYNVIIADMFPDD